MRCRKKHDALGVVGDTFPVWVPEITRMPQCLLYDQGQRTLSAFSCK
jgi:hypothetical protein